MKPADFLFPREAELVKESICPFCHVPVDTEGFRDQLSVKEFAISGLCQNCQDEVFGK